MDDLELDKEEIAKLGRWLSGQYEKYKSDRREAEKQWMKNLRQYLGKYDPEIEDKLEPTQSRNYPKVTRVKVISMVSRLMSLMFPSAEKNYSIEASKDPTVDQETLQRILDAAQATLGAEDITPELVEKLVAEAVADSARYTEKLVEDQLSDTDSEDFKDYAALVRRVLFSGVLLSTGVLKGPMTVQYKRAYYERNEAGQWEAKNRTAYRPYFEFVPLWDYYPDMSAKTWDQMDGQFQRHIYSHAQLKKLGKRSDFIGKQINEFLAKNPAGNYKRQEYETELQQLGDTHIHGEDKYEVSEFWGYVTGSQLRAAGVKVEDSELSSLIRANIWLLEDVVIKAKKNPFDKRQKLYHQFIFEEDEVHLTGSGLPPIVRDSQMSIASAARMLMDNAAAVSGPSAEFDMTLLEPGSDTSIRPYACYRRDVDAPGDGRRAVQEVKFDSHIPELLNIVNTFQRFADQETFVGPLTGGDTSDVPSEAMRTQGGASMLFGSAALPFQDIVRNFDMFTTSVIQSLIAWNRMFNNNDKRIMGDLRPVARGTKGLLAKEVRAFALDNLVNTMTEEEKLWVDDEQLVKERFAVRDLPTDRLLVTKEEHDRRVKVREQREAAQQALQDALIQAKTQKENNSALKDASQARKNLDNADVALFEAVKSALEAGIDPETINDYVGRAQETLTQDEPGLVPGEGEAGGPSLAAVPEGARGGAAAALAQGGL